MKAGIRNAKFAKEHSQMSSGTTAKFPRKPASLVTTQYVILVSQPLEGSGKAAPVKGPTRSHLSSTGG
jgi:hypothetical protein